jgi:hypothetical protein
MLQTIVPNTTGSIQRLFNVACFKVYVLPRAIGMVRPDASKTVCL